MERLLAIAAEYNTTVKIATLPEGVRGFRDRANSIIYLNRRLHLPGRRVTLGHELGHDYWGHDCTTSTAENQANDYAARLLIAPSDYAAAERVSPDPHYLAEELGVTVEMIHHYQRFALQRLGDRTYVRESHLERTAPRQVA